MKIPIFSYHSIGDDKCPLSTDTKDFEKHLIYLKKNNYKSIFFGEVSSSNKRNFIMTFDDGYKDLISNCLPLLKKYNFKATCFLVSDKIGKINDWDKENKNIKTKKIMDESDIRIWIKNGMKIGSHSKNHKILTKIDQNELTKEISSSKIELEKLIGEEVVSFCYPYGKFNLDVINEVKKNYRYALTTLRSRYDPNKHDKYLMPRIDMGKKLSNFKLFLKIKTPYEDLKYDRKQIHM